ncbi:MAG: LysM peptidoglycan-binding domain-containing protein [Burkholderiales bacterium]|nr:LysM peptidoglycan-binding domain-containing protein [Burkholderiales bacterium]
MLQQFNTAIRHASAAAAWGLLALCGAVGAQNLQVADQAPTSYTVQKGDTLWGISGKFLKEPWRWPEVWRMNKEQIRNPHLIYPGDVVRLEYENGQPKLSIADDTVRLSPTTRVSALRADAIPSISPNDIEPYLTRPLVTGPSGLYDAAEILHGRNDSRVVRGTGDVVYVLGIDPKAGDYWYIYRPAGAIVNLDGTEVLGYESKFLGTARVEKFGELATVRIETANQEIQIGDRLLPAPRETLVNYVPHAPDKPVNARILRVPFNGVETGRGGIVTLDQGTRDGIEVGHVLAVYRVIAPIVDPRPSRQQATILRFLDNTTTFTPREYVAPADERTGLLFVFRTFDRVSFAVVLNSTDPVRTGDFARTP